MSDAIASLLAALALLSSSGPPGVPQDYIDRGLVRGDECGVHTRHCWHALRVYGIGPLTLHPQTGMTWLATLGRLSWCESRHKAHTRYVNKNGSIDRGPWQINDGWWPDISDAQAHDPWFSTLWTVGKLKRGLHGLWVCWRIAFA